MNFQNKTAILAVVILVATLAVPAVGQPERGIEVGQKIKPRQFRTIEREKIILPVEEGLTVLLFWSTWSPRSEPALQLWKKYGDEYRDYGVNVFTINADHQDMQPEDVQKVREYIAQREIDLPVVVDSQLEFFNEIGVIVLPTVLFFKPDGTLDYKYASFPSSAELDLKEDLEAKLGIADEPTAEEETTRGKLTYQPKNNALLFFGLGKRYHEKGYPEKARDKYIEALQKDSEYADPLRSLERLFFDKGRTPEAEDRLKTLLTDSGLEAVIGSIQEEPEGMEVEQMSAPEATAQSGQVSAQAATPEAKKLTPMERMKLLMEKGK
ncbi:MAG: redoxin domain-containing protein [bacterium]|nr:redoxin domain-containing protein [bacterium]MDT8364998.1 redoxin domain-containing protein [bacterium]